MPGAIEDSGFSSGKIFIVATGRIKSDKKERLLFRIDGSKENFLLKDLKSAVKKEALKHAEACALVKASAPGVVLVRLVPAIGRLSSVFNRYSFRDLKHVLNRICRDRTHVSVSPAPV